MIIGFAQTAAIGGYSTSTIEVLSVAAGGSDRETVEEIKTSSPLQFTTQNRLVTIKDYESYIKKNYPSIDSLSVWGGEDEVPAVYGKVLISLKPKANYYITEIEKTRILNEIIKPKSIVSVSAEIRDAEFLFILLNTTVKYDSKRTTLSEAILKSSIRNAIISYRDTNLNKFGSIFAKKYNLNCSTTKINKKKYDMYVPSTNKIKKELNLITKFNSLQAVNETISLLKKNEKN